MANYYGDSSSPSQTILIHPSVVYKGKSWTEDLGRVIRVKRGNGEIYKHSLEELYCNIKVFDRSCM